MHCSLKRVDFISPLAGINSATVCFTRLSARSVKINVLFVSDAEKGMLGKLKQYNTPKAVNGVIFSVLSKVKLTDSRKLNSLVAASFVFVHVAV